MSFVVALLGAESTGKTTLARELGAALAAEGRRVEVVAEYLREFCDTHGRTPRIDEQRGIAREQAARIAAATARVDVVVADTTALMIAVYSDWVFADRGLYDEALVEHGRCDLTLLTALDLPWQADGHQRDGEHVREPIDAMVRAALDGAGLAWSLVAGLGGQRLDRALAAVRGALARRDASAATGPRWQWTCDRCGEAGCERHWLAREAGARRETP